MEIFIKNMGWKMTDCYFYDERFIFSGIGLGFRDLFDLANGERSFDSDGKRVTI
jgi:hypothetical protein